MATKYDQSSATRPVSIRSHTSAFQVHFKHTSSALEMSSVNPPNLRKLTHLTFISVYETMLMRDQRMREFSKYTHHTLQSL